PHPQQFPTRRSSDLTALENGHADAKPGPCGEWTQPEIVSNSGKNERKKDMAERIGIYEHTGAFRKRAHHANPPGHVPDRDVRTRSEEHTSELQSREN